MEATEQSSGKQVDEPELVVGLIAAVGTDLELVCTALRDSLSTVNYRCETIRLSQLLHEIPQEPWKSLPNSPEDERLNKHMDAGNSLREKIKRGDALALLAIGAIREERENFTSEANKPIPRQAYILRSLKHPDEVLTLRRIYGPRFVLLAAYSPREKRLQNLARRITESHHLFRTDECRQHAESLIQRDEAEVDKNFGQNVRETFPKADVFINTSNPLELRASVSRFVELLFGITNPIQTPTRDEYGMFHAQAAAFRSASLARQVGAVVATDDGDIVAVGTNEVPKFGGGLYWSGDTPDHRDFVLGYDTSDRLRRLLLADILKRLQSEGWLAKEKGGEDITGLVEKALTGNPSLFMKGAHFMNLIEFSRAVHAEMAALTDAARRGVAVRGCVLYTTTFPCHDCARHIVAAGIKRVIYVEPYPKSLVPELYPDSISVDPDSSEKDSSQVCFKPFVGVGPRRYMELFSATKRKEKDGRVVFQDKSRAVPRLGEWPASYFLTLVGEEEEFNRFKGQMTENKLIEI